MLRKASPYITVSDGYMIFVRSVSIICFSFPSLTDLRSPLRSTPACLPSAEPASNCHPLLTVPCFQLRLLQNSLVSLRASQYRGLRCLSPAHRSRVYDGGFCQHFDPLRQLAVYLYTQPEEYNGTRSYDSSHQVAVSSLLSIY